MNKTELSAAVAAKADLTRKQAEAAVNAVVEAIEEALKNGEKVQVVGFGTFEVKDRPARKARNPRTGEEIRVEAAKTVKFKAGQRFKDAVNGGRWPVTRCMRPPHNTCRSRSCSPAPRRSRNASMRRRSDIAASLAMSMACSMV